MSINIDELSKIINDIYNELLENEDGNVADYIPQLGKVNPELFGISVCTVDGNIINPNQIIKSIRTRFK